MLDCEIVLPILLIIILLMVARLYWVLNIYDENFIKIQIFMHTHTITKQEEEN